MSRVDQLPPLRPFPNWTFVHDTTNKLTSLPPLPNWLLSTQTTSTPSRTVLLDPEDSDSEGIDPED